MTTTISGNPLGPFVEGPAAKYEPRGPDVLEGEENAPLWDYIPSGPFLDCPDFHAALNSSLNRFPNSFPYTIIDNTSQNPVRSQAFIYID
jgi:hypothetical protein